MSDDRKIFFAKLREVIDLKSAQKVKKLKSKDDSELKTRKKVNILDLDNNEMAKIRKEGQKVKIYDENNEEKFVEIVWPSNPTA